MNRLYCVSDAAPGLAADDPGQPIVLAGFKPAPTCPLGFFKHSDFLPKLTNDGGGLILCELPGDEFSAARFRKNPSTKGFPELNTKNILLITVGRRSYIWGRNEITRNAGPRVYYLLSEDYCALLSAPASSLSVSRFRACPPSFMGVSRMRGNSLKTG